MANVQLENGYFKIANDLFEQFFIRDFTLKQLKVLLLIIRFSYGFHKKVVAVKPQRLFELAYIYRCDIKEELNYLKQNKVIICNFKLGEFQLNKNFDEWKIPYHKLFSEDDLAKLKKINLEAKQIAKDFGYSDEVTPEDVCETQTDEFVNYKQNEENVCEMQTEMFVNNKQNCTDKNESLQNTNKVVCEIQTEVFVNNKQTQAENTDSASDTTAPKYREIIEKYNNKDIYINKDNSSKEDFKIDPYINPYKKIFIEEYKKIFKRDCFLNNTQHLKLVEIAAEIPNFKDLIPTLVLKFSKITFDFDGVKKQPGLRWLLEEGNWAGVLSGEFDNHIVENQTKGDKNDGYSY